VAEEEGDDEDDQQDLGEQEEGDADPEAEADFLFKVHGAEVIEKIRWETESSPKDWVST
jgi:hypothetical protein